MSDDWDDVLRAELAHAQDVPVCQGSSDNTSTAAVEPEPRVGLNPLKRGRGRPRGVTKSVHNDHSHSLQGPDSQDGSEAAEAGGGRGGSANMQLVRAMRRSSASHTFSPSRANSEDIVMPCGPKSLLTELGSAVQRTFGSAVLAVWGLLSKLKQTTGVQDVPQDTVVAHILEGDVLTCSSSSVAKVTGSTRSVVQNTLLAAGSATLEGAGLLWSVMLTSLSRVQRATAGMKPLMFCVNIKFDETPTKVRVASLDADSTDSNLLNTHGQHILVPRAASSGQHLQRFLQLLSVAPKVAPQSATHAKVLQTEIQLGFLYQTMSPDGDKKHLWLTGTVPCALQAMDRSTGEAQLSCVLENLAVVPELQRLSQDFPLQIRTVTTDKYGANA